MLIEKHNLAQDKVKLVFVVHPNGKKFMSLILDLVVLAIKEIMKRRKFSPGKSFDIEKVTEACSNMKKIETDLSTNIKIEADVIIVKTREIQELIGKIFPANEFALSFEEFIEAWNEYNQSQLTEIKLRDKRMELVYKQTAELHARAQEMLLPKNYEISSPLLDDIKEVSTFYDNAGVTSDTIPSPITNDALSFSWLIAQLHLVLPAIIKYTSNFSLDPSNTSLEELKVLKRLSLELSKIESKADKFSANFKKEMAGLVVKLKTAKEQRKRQEEETLSPEVVAEKATKNAIEFEKLKLVNSPKLYLDTTKECLNHVVLKKDRLALMNDEEGKESLANETMYYPRSKASHLNGQSKLNNSKNATMNFIDMAPPKMKPRRRLDPIQMLEKATSNEPRNRHDLNSTTKYTGAVPKHSKVSPRFSSTMISPNLHQHFFNCSTLSEINKGSPILQAPGSPFQCFDAISIPESPVNFNLEIFQAQKKPVDCQGVMWKDIDKSPKGKLNPLVQADEIFKISPKLALNDITLVNDTLSNSSEVENTVINQQSNMSEGAACLSSSFSFGSIRLPTDENLFNISDSILRSIED